MHSLKLISTFACVVTATAALGEDPAPASAPVAVTSAPTPVETPDPAPSLTVDALPASPPSPTVNIAGICVGELTSVIERRGESLFSLGPARVKRRLE